MAGDKDRKDFVMVKLSAAGETFAGRGPLHIANAHHQFTFKAGQEVEVTLLEWKFLSAQKHKGDAIFELVKPPEAVFTGSAVGQEA